MPPTDTKKIKMLAIDDDTQWLDLLMEYFAPTKVRPLIASTAIEGLEICSLERPDVVLLDLVMPGVQGMELLVKLLRVHPTTNVLLLTGHYSMESAVAAIQSGASDYLAKPLALEALEVKLGRFLREADQRARTQSLESEMVESYNFGGIISQSPDVLGVLSMVQRIAPHYRTVLINGDTGTGKELVARTLHNLSPVGSKPLVVCNCTTLTETLAESILFGYMKGSFTGASENRAGVFEHADGGTVFLDEIGELPLALQAKLLRVLQTGEVQRIGSPATKMVDIRVIAATHRDLRAMVSRGEFREDLFYRLSMVQLALPPLRKRREDLPLLQNFFLNQFVTKYNKNITGLSHKARRLLNAHHWPGNIRELEHVIGSACMLARGDMIEVDDLPEHLRKGHPVYETDAGTFHSLREVNVRYANQVLAAMDGNKLKAAEVLGITRATLYKLLGTKSGSSA